AGPAPGGGAPGGGGGGVGREGRGGERARPRRYESASAFGADVQRYLNDQPVQACPPSAWYRFRKFARRNKRVLAAASLLFAMLVVAVAVLGASYAQVKEALHEKSQALEEKQE